MPRFTHVSQIALIISLGSGGAAFADVTAQQVWDNWKDMMSVYGEEGITIGSETASGDTLTVSDLTMSMSDSDASVDATINSITFTELGDGTVSVEMSPENVINLEIEGDPVTILARNDGLNMIVSGSEAEMNYALTANSYELVVTEIGGDDAVLNDMRATISGISGNYVTRKDNLQHITYNMNADRVDVVVDVTEAGSSGVFQVTSTLADLTAAAQMTMPLDMDMDNPDNMFVEGFSVTGGYTVGASENTINVNADGELVQGSTTASGANLAIAFGMDGFDYAGGIQDLDVNLLTSEFPLPMAASMDELAYNIKMPLSKSDAPAPFGLGLNLANLTVDDMLWGLFDPAAVLPRDPATVAFDITGNAQLFFDILDPAQADAMAMSDMPGELHDMTLNNLTVSLAGAEVIGDGSFTFDNSDLDTFDGLPRPMGELNFAINGANGLLDKLIQMGLVSEQDSMGVRMMMGLFTTPVGDDQLSSTIEINEQGHVLANGQRLQ